MSPPITPVVYVRGGAVQLKERHGDVCSGSLGYIVGSFARENPTYLVSFGAEGVMELRGDEITASVA